MRRRDVDSREEILYGVHPVLEALETHKRTLERILVAQKVANPRVGRVLRAARLAGVPISHLPREVLMKKLGPRAVHQGVAAVVSAVPYADADELCIGAEADPQAIVIALQRVEDPRNLGAILRTAAAAGARGVLVGVEGMVGLTPTVAKASAGTLERIAVAREPRLSDRLKRLKEFGFRVVALDPEGAHAWDAVDLSGRLVVVAGGEARGLSPKILEAADARVAIPMAAGVESLNVSVAVGVVLFEALRRRRMATARNSHEFSVPRS